VTDEISPAERQRLRHRIWSRRRRVFNRTVAAAAGVLVLVAVGVGSLMVDRGAPTWAIVTYACLAPGGLLLLAVLIGVVAERAATAPLERSIR
jgi:hypothetical protein